MATPERSRLEEGIVEALKTDRESYGRALAARLHADSGAVARCLVRLEQKGVLRSRWIGRSRLYRFARAQVEQRDPLVERAISRLKQVKDPAPLAILPFGSRATGQARKDSDLDIIVVVPDGKNDMAGWTKLRDAIGDLPVGVDLLVYSESGARKWASLPANVLRDALDAQSVPVPDFLVA